MHCPVFPLIVLIQPHARFVHICCVFCCMSHQCCISTIHVVQLHAYPIFRLLLAAMIVLIRCYCGCCRLINASHSILQTSCGHLAPWVTSPASICLTSFLSKPLSSWLDSTLRTLPTSSGPLPGLTASVGNAVNPLIGVSFACYLVLNFSNKPVCYTVFLA